MSWIAELAFQFIFELVTWPFEQRLGRKIEKRQRGKRKANGQKK